MKVFLQTGSSGRAPGPPEKRFLIRMTAVVVLGLLGMVAAGIAQADTFGHGADTFTIDFVDVGNAGNANDRGLFGGVAYDYRIGICEIPLDGITKATTLGLAHVRADDRMGNEPATSISWYEAAAFVNWLNTSKGYQSAYDLTYTTDNILHPWLLSEWNIDDQASTGVDLSIGRNPFRHKNAVYFLPSEDEWYKAAYHQNDGVTVNYWDYATGSNTTPTPVASGTAQGSAVYDQSIATGPADVSQAGGLSPYGTMGQNGNVWEWTESTVDGENGLTFGDRMVRGGGWDDPAFNLDSGVRMGIEPTYEDSRIGFRVASVPEANIPEPSAAFLMLMAGGALLLGRTSRSGRRHRPTGKALAKPQRA